MEDELIGAQRADAAANNASTTSGIMIVTTQVDEVPLVDNDEESDGEEVPDPIMDLEDKQKY